MSDSPASRLVIEALRSDGEGTLVLAPELQLALGKDLEARALLPTAEQDLADVIRLAAFLGVEKKNPRVAEAVLAALGPMIAAMSARNVEAAANAEAQMGSARQLIGAEAKARALQGEGILAAGKQGGLGAELSERFKAEHARSLPRPSRKPK